MLGFVIQCCANSVLIFIIRMVRANMDPPQLGQLLEQMTEVMTQLARNQELNEQRFANNNNNNNRNGRTTLRDFLQLNPRTFASSSQPLDADDWLGEMNRTIKAANVSPEDRVTFVTFLLKGESAAWWQTRQALRAADAPVTWEEFQRLFRSHHIPDSVMDMKREEFCRLAQGSKDVLTYSKEFIDLSRYAGDEISTEEKKQKRFRNGLNPAIKFSLNLITCQNFEQLVNLAIKAEQGRKEFDISRKQPRDVGSSSSTMPSQKRRMWVQ